MDVLSGSLWVPWTPLRHHLAYVRSILPGGINPSVVAKPFQAKGSTDAKRLCVSPGCSMKTCTLIGIWYLGARPPALEGFIYVFRAAHTLVSDAKADVSLIL